MQVSHLRPLDVVMCWSCLAYSGYARPNRALLPGLYEQVKSEEPGASANAGLRTSDRSSDWRVPGRMLRSAPPFLQGTALEFPAKLPDLGRGSIAPRLTVGRCLVASAAARRRPGYHPS